MHNFDREIIRKGTKCAKFDGMGKLDEYRGLSVIPMWVADMDFEVDQSIHEAILKRAKHGIYGYAGAFEELFEAVSAWMERRHNVNIKIDDLVFSPSVVVSLNLLIRAFTKKGDKILIQSPVYHQFYNVIEKNERQISINKLLNNNGKYEIDFEDFDKKAKSAKMFILCNPHNPVGRAWSEHELEKMVSICKKNKVTIVSDEIHMDFVFSGHKHHSLLKMYPHPEEEIVVCTSPSKTFNLAGLQTSFVMAKNKSILAKFNKELDQVGLNAPNVFGIEATIAAYTCAELWVDLLRSYIEKNYDYTVKYIRNNIPEIDVIQSESTFLIWLDCRRLQEKIKKNIQKYFLEESAVLFNDGETFGENGKGYLRMNIGCPLSKIEEALERIEAMVKRM